MLRQMGARQFIRWRDFDSLEPIGDLRADYHAAMIARTVAASGGAKGTKLEDFMLKFEERDEPAPAKRQTWQEQKMIGMMFAAASKRKRK